MTAVPREPIASAVVNTNFDFGVIGDAAATAVGAVSVAAAVEGVAVAGERADGAEVAADTTMVKVVDAALPYGSVAVTVSVCKPISALTGNHEKTFGELMALIGTVLVPLNESLTANVELASAPASTANETVEPTLAALPG